jgi:hypothetical protein
VLNLELAFFYDCFERIDNFDVLVLVLVFST